MPKSKSLVKISNNKIESLKFLLWTKFFSKVPFKLAKKSKAGVVTNKTGTPEYFIFDTHALLDVFSEIDSNLCEKLSNEDYYSKKINPAGWLIDEIESKIPTSLTFTRSLAEVIKEADKKGWIPLERVRKEVGLT